MKKLDAKRCTTTEEKYPQLASVMPSLRIADPTKHLCTYMDWLCKAYLRNEFLLEDINMIADDLLLYHNNKNRFALDKRDINKFTYTSLKIFLDEVFKKEVDVTSVYSSDADKKILYSGPLGTLIVPLTEKGSMEVGGGTKWLVK